MEVVLYGDILFLINFSMDFLTLFVTSKILHLKSRLSSMILSSIIGAVYAVVSVLFEGAVIFSMIINVCVSFLMCYISFGKRTLRCTALFYTIGLVLGGALTASFTLINKLRGSKTIFVNGSTAVLSGNIPLGWMAVITVLTCIAAILSGRFAKASKSASEVSVKIEDELKVTVIKGLADSGNLLKDPFDGTPVIVTSKEVLLDLIPSELESCYLSKGLSDMECIEPRLMKRIRFIPANGISGKPELFMGYVPENVEINGILKKACIAADFSEGESPGFGGFDAIVPSCLL